MKPRFTSVSTELLDLDTVLQNGLIYGLHFFLNIKKPNTNWVIKKVLKNTKVVQLDKDAAIIHIRSRQALRLYKPLSNCYGKSHVCNLI
jgi:hypothetical protein